MKGKFVSAHPKITSNFCLVDKDMTKYVPDFETQKFGHDVIRLKEIMCVCLINYIHLVTCNTGVKRFDSNQAGQSQPKTLSWRPQSWSLGGRWTPANLTLEMKRQSN